MKQTELHYFTYIFLNRPVKPLKTECLPNFMTGAYEQAREKDPSRGDFFHHTLFPLTLKILRGLCP